MIQVCLVVLLLIMLFPILPQSSYGQEPILISISSSMDKVIFDGKWSSITEWKQSSYNSFRFENDTLVHLRSAHQGDFIYIHINAATDTTLNKGSDGAAVCFDTKNDKTAISQQDDYCFSITLDTKSAAAWQGNNKTNNSFTKIQNHEDFVAIGTISDKFDRYNKVPHASYEFKIPLHVLSRSDNYGFFVSVYEGDSQTRYMWPYHTDQQDLLNFSSPSSWGQLISPDKSLPEFSFSQVLLFTIPGIILIYMVSRSKLQIRF